jgi:hypothetical protein
MVDLIPCPISEERWRKPNEEEDLKVYTRRRAMVEERGRKFKGVYKVAITT